MNRADLIAVIFADDAPPFDAALPYVDRGATQMTPRETDIAKRSYAGDDGIDGDLKFHNVHHALKQWHGWFNADATKRKSSGERERFMGRVDGGKAPTVPGRLAAKLHAWSVGKSVRAACAAGFATTDRRVRLNKDEVARVVVGILEGLSAQQIADDLNAARAATGEHRVTAVHVGRCDARARRAVAADLVNRGLLERPRDTQSVKRSDAMAAPPGYDLETWKEIAGHCGLSVSRVQTLSREAADPLPVSDYLGRVVARRVDVDAWRTRQVRTRDSRD